MSTIPYPSDYNTNKRYNYSNYSQNPSYDQSRSKLRGKLSTSINMSHNLDGSLNPLINDDQPHNSRNSNYTFSTNDTMIHSTTNYSYSKDELSKYGTMNDLTSMQSNNIFNMGLGDSQYIGKAGEGTGYKEIFREQMEQAKLNYEKMSET